ncbi:MAG: hypothetical protein IPK26_19645 [Planctomycetes bacterium]|nr:hypothetical protein [Planctomycetota bacterium]
MITKTVAHIDLAVRLIAGSAALLTLATAAAAQRPRSSGAFAVQYSLGATWGEVTHFAKTPDSVRQMTWFPYVTAVPSAQFAMPFDLPGSCEYLGNGQFLASGKETTNGNGYLVRFSIASTPTLQLTIEESVAIPGYDPLDIHYDVSGRIFLYDVWARSVRMAPWLVGAALPTQFGVIADLSGVGWTPWTIGSHFPDETPGIYLRAVEGAALDPDHRVRLFQDGSGNWQVENLVVVRQPISTGWSVREPIRVPHEGTIELANGGGGAFSIKNLETLAIVLQGSIPPATGWHPVSVPPGAFQVGASYFVEAVGASAPSSKPFEPTFRFGSPTMQDSYQMKEGWYRPATMTVGNSGFTVFTDLIWASGGAAPAGDVYGYLWAAAEEPSSTSVTTLPTGETVLAHPQAMFTSELHAAPDETFGLPLYMQVPVPNHENLVGQAILWQWFGVTPTNKIVVSDVFGSRIKGTASAARSSNGGGSQPQSGGTGPQTPEQRAAREEAARRWLERASGGRGANGGYQEWLRQLAGGRR